MIDERKLLEDIYKYYSIDSNDNVCINSKHCLRQAKINKKGLFKEQKIFQEIIGSLNEYTIIDWTDENACCYEIKILLHKNQDILDDDKRLINALGGVRRDVRVFISILEPYYYLFLEETKYIEKNEQWLFETIKEPAQEFIEVIRKIDNCLLKSGYKKLQDNDVKVILPGIGTELKELGKATVFDCLFTDVVSL